MPRSKRSAAEVEAMRERILDATHSLVRAGGPRKATMRAVAQSLGLSPTALYTYFPNRAARPAPRRGHRAQHHQRPDASLPQRPPAR